MKAARSTTETVDEYIAASPPDVQPILQKIRMTIAKAAPGAQERISYRMPAVTVGGRILIYYAAFKNHIGLYPPVKGGKADAKLMKEIARYRGEKGNLKLPLDEPMPYALIGRIVKLRLKQQATAAKTGHKGV